MVACGEEYNCGTPIIGKMIMRCEVCVSESQESHNIY